MPEIAVTDHAVSRYRERVKPALSFGQAEDELLAVLRLASFQEWAPGWCERTEEHPDGTVGYVIVCDGVCLPVTRQESGSLAAVTCLTRCEMPSEVRALVNERNARNRFRRRAHRQKWRGPRDGKQVVASSR